MSAFYSMCFQDRIELLTDAAQYDQHGTILAFERRVFPAHELPMVITGRGSSNSIKAFADRFNELALAAGNVDRALKMIASFIADFKPYADKTEIGHAEILIPCISESYGPSNWYFSTVDAYGIYEPWKIGMVDREFALGSVRSVEIDMMALQRKFEQGGFASAGLEILELMRREKGVRHSGGEPIYGIGGFVDHTVISREGVTVSKIHEWPDEIGKKIDPFSISELMAAE